MFSVSFGKIINNLLALLFCSRTEERSGCFFKKLLPPVRMRTKEAFLLKIVNCKITIYGIKKIGHSNWDQNARKSSYKSDSINLVDLDSSDNIIYIYISVGKALLK